MSEEKKSIGGLWLKRDNSGNVYMSGNITIGEEKVGIVVFSNKYKKPDNKQPDYNILKTQPALPSDLIRIFSNPWNEKIPMAPVDDIPCDDIPF